jgi:hypothetical protein
MAAPAKAAIVYQYVTPLTSYTTASNVSLAVNIYLDEILSGGSTSLITSDGGLYGAGFSVTQTNNTSSPALTALTGSTTTGAPFANGSYKTGITATNELAGSENVANGTTSGPTPTAGLILLGTVTITPTSAGTYSFSLANYSAPAKTGGYTQTFGNGPGGSTSLGYFDLDPNNTGTYAYAGAASDPETFTVTVPGVPEPMALGLISLASMGLLTRPRRRMD